jgi:hypothetical protein
MGNGQNPNMGRVMAEHPFRVFSMEARNAERRAEGFVFEGCVPAEGPSNMTRAEARRVAAEWSKQFEHGPEGRHFVGCEHHVSEAQMKREGF